MSDQTAGEPALVSSSMQNLRLYAPRAGALVLLVGLAACNAQSQNAVPPNPPGVTCSIGTQVQTSSPLPNAGGVATNIGRVQIVVNTTVDVLGGNWNLILVDQFGTKIQGGTLTLTTNPGGPHPFPSDYYYNASVSALTARDVYNVYINQFTSQCSPLFLNSFST